jgi:hypothetical protein
VGFAVGKLALGQVFLSEFLGFRLSVSLHCGSIFTPVIWEMDIGPISGLFPQRDSLTPSCKQEGGLKRFTLLTFT